VVAQPRKRKPIERHRFLSSPLCENRSPRRSKRAGPSARPSDHHFLILGEVFFAMMRPMINNESLKSGEKGLYSAATELSKINFTIVILCLLCLLAVFLQFAFFSKFPTL
jgi:hypothetical protein